MKTGKRAPAFTARQGEYLAFIAQYRDLMEGSPSEHEVAEFFGVSDPSAHQMMVTLERRDLLVRLPGVARSARVAVPRERLPWIGIGPRGTSDPVVGLTGFASFLAEQAVRRANSFAASFAVLRIAARLEALLLGLGAEAPVARQARAAVESLTPLKATTRSR